MDFRMNALLPRVIGSASLLALLAACDPAAMTGLATMTATPTVTAPVLAEGVYGARNDMNFVVPAVPVEQVPEAFRRQTVAYTSDQPLGTIIINPASKHLYLITGKNTAERYGI
jgi:lipoprotein-anchoring transpeptidase ErfK/SrfK